MKPAILLILTIDLILLPFLFRPSEEVSALSDLNINSDNSFISKELPRIAIAGLATESSTFSPALATEFDFRIRTGDAILGTYPFMAPDSLMRGRANWFPALVGGASPGGAVTRETYEKLVEKTLELLKKICRMTVSILTYTVQ